MGDARLSQAVLVVLTSNGAGTGPIRVSQVTAESAQQYSAVPVRASQVVAESAQQYSAVPLRVSQILAESTQQYGAVPVRLSQIVAESARQYATVPVRVSQICLEIMRPLSCETVIDDTPAPPVTQTFPIRRLRRTPHVYSGLDWLYYELLEIDIESGVGLRAGQGVDPQLMLRWSDDGGHTWSKEHWVSAGKVGKYQTRAIWRRLGRSRDRVFEVSMSDPVKWVITGARLDVKKGTS